MVFWVPELPLAQSLPAAPAMEIVQPQDVRPLPGQLDDIPTFNSNSPERIETEGILLSTFPPDGKRDPSAHLNVPLSGRFDVFAHHIYRAVTPDNLTPLYLGMLLHNPGTQPVRVDVLQAASYLSQPDAPFIALPPAVDNPTGAVFAGPGSRAMNAILRGQRDPQFPPVIEIPPGEMRLLLNLAIPVRELDPPVNGRSTMMRLRSSGPIYAASLALFARQNADGSDRPPTLEEWQSLLASGSVAGPRDRPPSPLDARAIIYGRVAGVAIGSEWRASLTDGPTVPHLTVPDPGNAISYGLSTLVAGRLGTEQVQTAPMQARYPDTAYQAHGNYGIQYTLSLPLLNASDQPRTVTLAVQTPIKEDTLSRNGLRFFETEQPQTFFRGTVRVRYVDDQRLPRTRYVHLVQRRGQQGTPLVELTLPPGDRRLLEFSFFYPPDATPPQVLTIRTTP